MFKNYYILAMPVLCLYACTTGNTSPKTSEKYKAYPVINVIEKDTSLHLQYVADIQARKNVEIHTRVTGILEHIHVDEGDQVHKGQLLFSINDDELQIALSKANAALNSAVADAKVAEVEVERVKMLVNKNIVSATELDLAETKLHVAKAKIEEARSEKAAVQKRLSYTRIYSPFDGVIDRLPMKAGSLLFEGSLLTTISDIHSVLAYFNISENEYLQLVRMHGDDSLSSNTVSLVLADGTQYPFKGKIEAAESEINDNTGTIAFRADFPNPNRILRHGASATLVISKPASRVLMVPQKSVLEIQDKNYVYVVDQKNVVKMKSFKPTHRLNDHYIVGDGLSANDKIIYEGIQFLRDGEQIVPITTQNM
ncbi:efflux RND transporter periplasmic adaptor subunit [Nemorincola caseinilytica]|uniref:Efflux RND transporter periplasmic adaptor subunit n=1 Tax=Nemorincola caseinilytica TaxID=2054315 RepID=A0ABP8NIW6_9BACT